MQTEALRKLNEGFGGCYERIIFSKIISRIAKEYDCKSILELNATFVAGIPGFNSCILAQDSFDVSVAVSNRDYEDTCRAWELAGERNRAKIMKLEETSFTDNSYDLVWNHLVIDQYKKPETHTREMSKIANKVVINFMLNPCNFAYYLHVLQHKVNRIEWNHGYLRSSTIGAVSQAHKACGLEVIESGACDSPPIIDTVNGIIGQSTTYADNVPLLKDRWIWSAASKECQEHKLTRKVLEWEEQLPRWFKIFVSAHHLYCASKKI